MEANQDLQQVRNQICNWVLITVSICGVPALIGSLLRSVTFGLQWVMGVQVVALTMILAFASFHRVIPYRVRAGYVVFFFTFIGLIGMVKFGIVAGAIPMAVVSPILAAIFFGLGAGIICTSLTLSVMLFIAVGVVHGTLANNIDVAAHAALIPTWTGFLMVVIMSIAAPTTAIVMIERHLTSALVLSRRSEEELESLVAERTHALKLAKQEAEHLARTDVLTGLNNRRAFYEYATILDGQARRHHHTYVILMLDIDYFKEINDTRGHESGDAVLHFLGNIIKEMFRTTDIVARVGGEEFAIILPTTNLETARALAEKLRARIEGYSVHAPKGEVHITVSIGIAKLDPTTATLEQVISNADTALYQAKQNGRNRVETFQSNAVTLFTQGGGAHR